MIARGIAAQ